MTRSPRSATPRPAIPSDRDGSSARSAAFTLTDVVKEYRDGDSVHRALDGVSLQIEAGAFVAVMGPSGSGKSTLLNLLGALDTPTSGSVRFLGQRFEELDDEARTAVRREQLGFVFQAFHLVDILTVAENVALQDGIRRESHRGSAGTDAAARVARLLADVGLDGYQHKLPDRLSGGEQQRVAIARALYAEPAALLADEPTGNLDRQSGDAVLRLLRAANTVRGCTVILVTHDPHAASMADRVLLLRDGRCADALDLAAEGSPDAQRVSAWLAAASA